MKTKDQVIDDLMVNFNECWNNGNKLGKLNPELLALVRIHIDQAFVIAIEKAFCAINDLINDRCGIGNIQISLSFVRSLINPNNYDF